MSKKLLKVNIFSSVVETTEDDIDWKAISKDLKSNFKGDDYCIEQYNKYKHIYPLKEAQVREIVRKDGIEKLRDIIHGAVVWFQTEQIYTKQELKTINTSDLFNFLNDTKPIFDEQTKEISRNNNGSDFLNYFIQDDMLDVVVATKANYSVKDIIDNKQRVFNAVCKLLVFQPLVTLSRIFAAMKMTNGIQVVSNFRPMSAYYLYSLGLESMRARGDNTLYIKVPSEGWLGRLLAAHKIAYDNPDIKVVYDSIDPNIAVCKRFKEVCNYLQNELPGIRKINNIEARIHAIGSETESAIFSNVYGYKYDVIGTSPPYFDTETYTEGSIITLLDLETDKESVKSYANTEVMQCDSKGAISVDKLQVGEVITKGNKKFQIISKVKSGQSRNKTSGPKAWNETFLRPTFENNFKDLHDTGILWWNIANVRNHPTFCADSEKIALETGFKLVDTLKYKLSRVPGGITITDKDGTKKKVNLRDLKDNFEPVYIYKKHLDF